MKVYILVYRGTVYGVFDSREKARAARRRADFDGEILERRVQ